MHTVKVTHFHDDPAKDHSIPCANVEAAKLLLHDRPAGDVHTSVVYEDDISVCHRSWDSAAGIELDWHNVPTWR